MKDLNKIKDLVVKYTGIDIVKHQGQNREYVNARYLYFKLARKHTHFADKLIGDLVGKDRTTVIYGSLNFENRLPYEPELNDIYRELDIVVSNDVTNQIPKVNGIINMLPKADVDTIETVYRLLRKDRMKKKKMFI